MSASRGLEGACVVHLLIDWFSVHYDVLTSQKKRRKKTHSGWEETAPPWVSHFLEVPTDPVENTPPTCELPSPEPYLLYLALRLRPLGPDAWDEGPRTQGSQPVQITPTRPFYTAPPPCPAAPPPPAFCLPGTPVVPHVVPRAAPPGSRTCDHKTLCCSLGLSRVSSLATPHENTPQSHVPRRVGPLFLVLLNEDLSSRLVLNLLSHTTPGGLGGRPREEKKAFKQTDLESQPLH